MAINLNWRHRKFYLAIVLSLVFFSPVIGSAYYLWPRDVVVQPRTYTNKAVSAGSPATVTNRSLPARLQIPRLKVDAAVEYMGLTAAGDMVAPSKYTEAGWYKYGPLPGNKGNAVIDGHVIGPQGQPGIFSGLSKLLPGDIVSVIDTNDQKTDFIVTGSRNFSESAKTKDVLPSEDGAHLILITCTGTWDQARRHYLERLAVFADKLP
ncbi:MAG: class F sortase [Candidatus Saccharimonadales bacterium]